MKNVVALVFVLVALLALVVGVALAGAWVFMTLAGAAFWISFWIVFVVEIVSTVIQMLSSWLREQ